jgi:hypothetical protein
MSGVISVEKDFVEAITRFVDTLHHHYSGITIRPISKFEDEDLTFEITIPKNLGYHQVLETCHQECIKIEDEFDLFIFPHIVYEGN